MRHMVLNFDAQESRLRCMPHTIHLAAMEASQKIIVHIYGQSCNLRLLDLVVIWHRCYEKR